ncbi:hypothetical protein [Niabella aquatica]
MIKIKASLRCLTAAAILTAFSFTSCKKGSSGSDTGVGKASIQFSTNKSFGGKNEFKSNTVAGAFANKSNTVNRTQITITAIQTNGTQIGTAQLAIHVPLNHTGTISGKFESSSSANTGAVLSIGISNAGSNQESYASSTGNFNITKLTDSEIEGTFDAYCINQTSNTNITLSNGKFSGKF